MHSDEEEIHTYVLICYTVFIPDLDPDLNSECSADT